MEYSPLSITHAEFRLLKIAPEISSLHDKIFCELQHESLAHPPPYIALSYHWGDPSHTQIIMASGRAVSVTTNLELALRHLRRAGHLTVWADALCINQSDVEERSLQVQRMPAVYGRAERVVAWLGSHENESKEAMEFLLQLQRHWPQTNCRDSTPWDALRSLFQRPYWERAWIIQEISVANRLQIMCGSSRCDFDGIRRFIRYRRSSYESVQVEAMAPWSTFKHVTQLSSIRNSIQGSEPLTLMELLGRIKGAKATDKKDKIFALISLSYDGIFLLPVPSYRLSSDQINFEISAAFIRRRKSFDLVVFTARPLFSQLHQDSRKWYPDWFCEDTWSEHRKIQYLKARKFSNSREIDALSPEAKFSTIPNTYGYPRLESDYFITNAVVIGEIDGLASTLQEASKTNPTRSRKASTQWQNIETVNSFSKEHYLPPIEYKDQIALTIYGLLTLRWNSRDSESDYSGLTWTWGQDHEDLDFIQFCTFFSRPKINMSGLQVGKDPHASWRSDFETLVDWAFSNREFRLTQDYSLLEVLCSEPPWIRDRHVVFTCNRSIIRMHRALLTGRRLSRTTAGYLGWVPEWSVEGDRLGLLEGCSVPVVLRCRPSGGYWIVGESYFVDLMDNVVSIPGIPLRRTWPSIKFY